MEDMFVQVIFSTADLRGRSTPGDTGRCIVTGSTLLVLELAWLAFLSLFIIPGDCQLAWHIWSRQKIRQIYADHTVRNITSQKVWTPHLLRLEQCSQPGAPCSYLSPALPSSCLQKHNFVRLLAYTFDQVREVQMQGNLRSHCLIHLQGLHIDSFKLPVACSCHVSPHYGPHRWPSEDTKFCSDRSTEPMANEPWTML